jgi:hypothetical protein
MMQLARYDWPGNVRELRNVLERAVIVAGEGVVTAEHLPPSFGSYSGIRRSAPIFGNPAKSGPWPQLFMLMPFDLALQPVFEDHVRPVASQLGLTAGRADDIFSTGSIVQEIWSAICHALVVVADCTHRNPNVFYEIGIAHTLGKDTILIAQSENDVPFDLRHLRFIRYEFTPRGMDEFERKLRNTLESVRQALWR